MKNKREFVSNLLYAFSAQIVSFILSFFMSLVVPKALGIEQYSYWQLFLFYTTYAGFLSFGFNDGLYLTLGGKQFDETFKEDVGPQIKINTIIQVFLVFLICIPMLGISHDPRRSLVIILMGIFAILNNLNADIGYFFQAINQTKKFSIATMLEKLTFLLFVVVITFVHVKRFEMFAYLYIVAKAVALIYNLYLARVMLRQKAKNISAIFRKMILNMRVGLNLMFANIASMLILGFGRKIIDIVWGIEAFGRFSFALSIENFFLVFIFQVSLVLFPALRRVNEKELANIYVAGQRILDYGLPAVYLCYFPIQLILGKWLPSYASSFVILGYLLPLCTFDGKMNLLCMTFLKVLRRERILLWINVATMIFSMVLSLLAALVFHSILMVVAFMVVSIAFRNILSEVVLSRVLNYKYLAGIITEVGLALTYILSMVLLGGFKAWIVYACIYGTYIWINRKIIINLIFGRLRIND